MFGWVVPAVRLIRGLLGVAKTVDDSGILPEAVEFIDGLSGGEQGPPMPLTSKDVARQREQAKASAVGHGIPPAVSAGGAGGAACERTPAPMAPAYHRGESPASRPKRPGPGGSRKPPRPR